MWCHESVPYARALWHVDDDVPRELVSTDVRHLSYQRTFRTSIFPDVALELLEDGREPRFVGTPQLFKWCAEVRFEVHFAPFAFEGDGWTWWGYWAAEERGMAVRTYARRSLRDNSLSLRQDPVLDCVLVLILWNPLRVDDSEGEPQRSCTLPSQPLNAAYL